MIRGKQEGELKDSPKVTSCAGVCVTVCVAIVAEATEVATA